ncbi:hypothetical protein Tco_0386769 [Tanacetum coccineum]
MRSLVYLSLPEFNLFSDPKDQFEEEETESMGEPTMEEYMTKTREDYGSGIARPSRWIWDMILWLIDYGEALKKKFLGKYCLLARIAKNDGRKSINITRARLTDDSYDEVEGLSGLIDREKSTTNSKRVLMEKQRMGYQIEASMNVHSSAVLEDSLPPKEKDTWSFTIPCYINNICFEKALADLGSSDLINQRTSYSNVEVSFGKVIKQNMMKQQADKHRTDRKLKVGDWVVLKLQPHRQVSIRQDRQNKFSPRSFRPFQVVREIEQVAYELALPTHA